MGGGLESRCVGRVSGADCAVQTGTYKIQFLFYVKPPLLRCLMRLTYWPGKIIIYIFIASQCILYIN